MKLFHAFMLFLAIIFTVPAYANVPDVSNLTSEQVIQLKAQLDAKDQIENSKSLPSQLNEWASLGKNIGQGLVGAAKEMGVAANDFANTTLGQTVIVMLVWKFFGKSVILFSMLFLIPLLIGPIVITAVKRSFAEYRTEIVEKCFGTLKWSKEIRNYNYDEAYYFFTAIAYIVLVGTWIACLVNL